MLFLHRPIANRPMKVIFCLLAGLFIFSACRKKDTVSTSQGLQKLQHDWRYISSRIFLPNGNIYILLNDTRTFRKDGISIGSRAGAGPGIVIYDTSAYKLLSNDQHLLFYAIRNNIQETKADTATIRELTDTSLVFYFQNNGFINFEASLRR